MHYIHPSENDTYCGIRGAPMKLTMNREDVTCPRCLEKMKTDFLCNCGQALVYEGDIAAPGFGRNWKCLTCGANYLETGGKPKNWNDIDPTIFEWGGEI